MNIKEEGWNGLMQLQKAGIDNIKHTLFIANTECYLSINQWIDTKELKIGYTTLREDVDICFGHCLPFERSIKRVLNLLEDYEIYTEVK